MSDTAKSNKTTIVIVVLVILVIIVIAAIYYWQKNSSNTTANNDVQVDTTNHTVNGIDGLLSSASGILNGFSFA